MWDQASHAFKQDLWTIVHPGGKWNLFFPLPYYLYSKLPTNLPVCPFKSREDQAGEKVFKNNLWKRIPLKNVVAQQIQLIWDCAVIRLFYPELFQIQLDTEPSGSHKHLKWEQNNLLKPSWTPCADLKFWGEGCILEALAHHTSHASSAWWLMRMS